MALDESGNEIGPNEARTLGEIIELKFMLDAGDSMWYSGIFDWCLVLCV